MSVDSDIIEGVFETLENVVDLPVAFPNVAYKGNKPYARPFILSAPNGEEAVSNNGFTQKLGILQVDVVSQEGKGSLSCEPTINLINVIFKKGTRIYKNNTVIRFDKAGYRSPAVQDGSEYYIPLNFNYVVLTDEV